MKEVYADTMVTTIKMDREIDKDKHYISIGGFEFCNKDKSIQFDYVVMCGYINENDKTTILFNLDTLDDNVFENCKEELTKEFCKSIDRIEEFYVYTGENGDPEINPVEILDIKFIFDDGEEVDIKKDVIKNYKF